MLKKLISLIMTLLIFNMYVLPATAKHIQNTNADKFSKSIHNDKDNSTNKIINRAINQPPRQKTFQPVLNISTDTPQGFDSGKNRTKINLLESKK